MSDRFEEIRAFVAVVDAGSFVGAADALRISKAAVSRLVAALEARLGTRLLHRTTRRLSLTDEGTLFHARCRAVLGDLDEAEAEVTVRTGAARGTLRLNVPVSFGILHLAPLWPAFMARNPQVTLEITLSDRLVDLVDEGYDLAVRIGRLAESSLVSRRLSSTRLVLCASPSYLERHGVPEHPGDLAAHAVLAYSLFSTGDRWDFSGPDGPVSVVVRPRLRTNSGDTCRSAALAGCGVILQPSFLIGDDLRTGRLVEILPSYRLPEPGIHAVYPSRRLVPAKVRALIDYLQMTLAPSV